jgi:hypothetical protein
VFGASSVLGGSAEAQDGQFAGLDLRQKGKTSNGAKSGAKDGRKEWRKKWRKRGRRAAGMAQKKGVDLFLWGNFKKAGVALRLV